jgi:hypothetical protein
LISRSTSSDGSIRLALQSALIGCTLYAGDPPRSLTMSIAICAPIAQGTDPAAANGPERS